jgi:hypothetical protein
MGGAEVDQTGVLQATGELKMPLNEIWAIYADGRLVWSPDPEYVRRRGEISHATIGLSYQH